VLGACERFVLKESTTVIMLKCWLPRTKFSCPNKLSLWTCALPHYK